VVIELVLEVHRPPDVLGDPDTMLLCVDRHLRYACPARSGPNWRTPVSKGSRSWKEVYDWIAEGMYRWTYLTDHAKYGPCLLLNDGGEVASRNPIPNPDGSTFRGVVVHSWAEEHWPGSAGCPTIRKVYWPGFLAHFRPGDTGTLQVLDLIGEPG
jgi:hypothetical protein